MDNNLNQQFQNFIDMKQTDINCPKKQKKSKQQFFILRYCESKKRQSSNSSSFPSDPDEYLQTLKKEMRKKLQLFDESVSSNRTGRYDQKQNSNNSLNKQISARNSNSSESTILNFQNTTKNNLKNQKYQIGKSNFSETVQKQKNLSQQSIKDQNQENRQDLSFQANGAVSQVSIQTSILSDCSSSPSNYLHPNSNIDFKKINMKIIKNCGQKLKTEKMEQKTDKNIMNQKYLKSIQISQRNKNKIYKQNRININVGKQFYQLGKKLNENQKLSNQNNKQKDIKTYNKISKLQNTSKNNQINRVNHTKQQSKRS